MLNWAGQTHRSARTVEEVVIQVKIVIFLWACFWGAAIAAPTSVLSLPISKSPSLAKQAVNYQSEVKLKALARSITVKVRVGKTWGSGILVRKQAQVYTVVTNQHVLNLGDRASIQTADGRIYPAQLRRQDFGERDLALLQFKSRSNYAIASLDRSSGVRVGDPVFAAGFPIESEFDRVASAKAGNPPTRLEAQGQDRRQEKNLMGFTFATGQISLLPTKVLIGGYQIGATNDVRKGMSGGPLLNRQGQVVGINGMHAYPIWGDPFVYTDGSHPERLQHNVMVRSSWAIPIETFSKIFNTY
jgi:S1-C subfamily serine protease